MLTEGDPGRRLSARPTPYPRRRPAPTRPSVGVPEQGTPAGLPQSLHVAALALLWLYAVRLFQDYVVNPRVAVQTVGLHR